MSCPVCRSPVQHELQIWEILQEGYEGVDGSRQVPISIIEDFQRLGLSARQIGRHLSQVCSGVTINPEAAVLCYFPASNQAVSFLKALLPEYTLAACREMAEGVRIKLPIVM